MPTVLDSFVIELGLDASKFTKGQREAYDAAKKLEDQQEKSAKNIEHSAGRAGDAIGMVKSQALQMLAVLTGGAGVIAFANNLTHADARLGRLERNLGVSASTISKWQGLTRIMGGDAQSMAQSFTTMSDAFAKWRTGGMAPAIPVLRQIGIEGGHLIDVNKGVEQSFIDLGIALKNIHDNPTLGPQVASLRGREAGIDPTLYDAMISPNGLQQILDYVKKIGVATTADVDAFGELEKRINQMGLKAESFGRRILGDGKDGGRGGASIIAALADELNKPASEARPWDAIFGWGQYAPGKGGGKMFPDAPVASGNANWRSAIANIESRGSGGYSAVGPVTRSGDRAYGKYQIMGNNIGEWSQAAMGKRMSIEEFMASPEAQDKIFDHKFGSYVKQFGNPQDAASAWLTGKPLSGGANRRDINGTSGAEYVRRFNAEGGGSSSTTTTEINVNGPVNVTPPAGAQPDEWGRSFVDAVKRQGQVAQANNGAQ